MNKQHIAAINDALFQANEAALKKALSSEYDVDRSLASMRASDIIGEMQDILRDHIHELAKATL